MGLAPVAPAAEAPVSMADAKAFCRVETDKYDEMIASLVLSAVGMVEAFTGKAMAAQSWLLTLDRFCDEIELPLGPVTEIAADGVKYSDEANVEQVLDPSVYQLDLVSDPQRLVRDPDESWPALGNIINPVRITFTAGFPELPDPFKTAILSLVSQWFDDRVAGDMPAGVMRMLSPYRRIVI